MDEALATVAEPLVESTSNLSKETLTNVVLFGATCAAAYGIGWATSRAITKYFAKKRLDAAADVLEAV